MVSIKFSLFLVKLTFCEDDLPIFGFIGTTNDYKEGETPKYYLYNHLDFLIEYNGDQVYYFKNNQIITITLILPNFLKLLVMGLLRTREN